MAQLTPEELSSERFGRGIKGEGGGKCSKCGKGVGGIQCWWSIPPGEPGEAELYCRKCAENIVIARWEARQFAMDKFGNLHEIRN